MSNKLIHLSLYADRVGGAYIETVICHLSRSTFP
jgi:hypothetical protein